MVLLHFNILVVLVYHKHQTTKLNAILSFSDCMQVKEACLYSVTLSSRKATEMETKSTTEHMMVAKEARKHVTTLLKELDSS